MVKNRELHEEAKTLVAIHGGSVRAASKYSGIARSTWRSRLELDPAIADAMDASAQTCLPRDQMIAALHAQFGETRRAVGLDQRGGVEVFASPSGSWTITITGPNGVACIISSGELFAMLPQGEMG